MTLSMRDRNAGGNASPGADADRDGLRGLPLG